MHNKRDEGRLGYARCARDPSGLFLTIAGLPLYKTFGKNKKIEFEFPGKTLQELINSLVRKFGFEVKKFLLDKNGDIDMDIRVLFNGATYLTENRMQTSLSDGDTPFLRHPPEDRRRESARMVARKA